MDKVKKYLTENVEEQQRMYVTWQKNADEQKYKLEEAIETLFQYKQMLKQTKK